MPLPTADGKRGRVMDGLISRQAAIDALIEWYGCEPSDIGAFENIIEKMPSAQPEVIRCGQCKYAKVADPEDSQDGHTCQFHRGSIWFSGTYCSWAERREDEH